MAAYIIRRILLAIPTLFGISVLSFVIMHLPPGDFLTSYASILSQQGEGIATEQLEQRVAALERIVADLQQKVAAGPPGKWWEQVGRPLSPEQREAFDQAAEYGRYFRKTGQMPPEDWKPGDPIPEPPESTGP